jgi:hypothetical protein
MYLLIKYPVGIIVEAVVLARGRDRMRVATAGFPDTVELKRSGSQWFTATRQPVEFEFLMSSANTGERVSSLKPAFRTGMAGSVATQC